MDLEVGMLVVRSELASWTSAARAGAYAVVLGGSAMISLPLLRRVRFPVA